MLKVHSRRASDVPAIDEQQIEQEEDERSLAGVAGILDEVEGRPAIRQHAAEFTVEVGGVGRQVDDGLRDAGVFSRSSRCPGGSAFARDRRRAERAFGSRRT